MLDRLRDAEMLDLRIGKDLFNRVDRSARYASTIENIHPVSAVALCRIVLDCGVERITVGGARRLTGVTRIIEEFGGSKGAAQAAKMRVARGSDVDVPVARSENARRDARRMIVASLRRYLAGDQPAHGLKIQHGDLALKQRSLHPLSLAGL